jgi:hypothetical protein
MGYAFFSVPLLILVDPGKGDLPIVSDADFLRQTTSAHQTSLSPCVAAHPRVVDRTAPSPAVDGISPVQTV